ncbi:MULTISPECIES: Lnb N-terminal periplasmic domain-containing protein [unclassified Pseudoalteromonas]|uniref:Lnb N-terminal periplasmic domain-containing protein n=1 Tax=unclassified Pseudoalteromonas TaxID=194690 RepID=UPI00301526E4
MLRLFLLTALVLLVHTTAWAKPNYIQLAKHPTWLKLGHYKAPLFNKSYVTSDHFFLAKNGHTNPHAELLATVTEFNQHPQSQCRFPARYQWLSAQGITFTAVKSACPDLTQWRDAQKIQSVSLVFASGYMSNPASLYGHMLLKLNRATEKHSKLLDYSINYGALVPDNENGLVYIAKGLFGGYQAGFSDQLFYRHRHNYGEVELRDLWEYQLNLTDAEVQLISNHIWELMGTDYTYYFADENCAYHIARVIELVVGDKLTPNLSPWVIPVTIFSNLAQSQHHGESLIKEVQFTPSRSSVFYQLQQQLSPKESEFAQRIYAQKSLLESAGFNSLPLSSKKRIIEVLFEFVQLQQLKKHRPEHNQTLKQALIASRLTLPPGNELSAKQYQQSAPHKAQKPSSYSLSGASTNHTRFAKAGFRLSYFDSLASDIARVPFSNLEMLDVEVAIKDSTIYLDKLHILDLESFNPAYTDWPNDGGWAWQLSAGFERDRSSCNQCSNTFIAGGVGKSLLFNNDKTLFYGFVNGYMGELANTSHHLEGSVEIGMLTDIYRGVKLRASIERPYEHATIDRKVEVVMPIHQDLDIRFAYQRKQQTLWQLKINYYWD